VCLVLLGWRAHPRCRLVVAANRDEFHDRATAPAGWWPGSPRILAGCDLKAGGTWLGITREDRFAALTNFRDPRMVRLDCPSRGPLVSRFLVGADSPWNYLRALADDADRYNPFNLLAGDRDSLFVLESRTRRLLEVEPGIHGLSNASLDTPWPKVEKGRSALAASLGDADDREAFFTILGDRAVAPDETLPQTGVGLEWERTLSAAFIAGPLYGTRSSTVLLVDSDDRLDLEERSFDATGVEKGRVRYQLSARGRAVSRRRGAVARR
jgi:uncharacterized protein with NRDE domain